MVHSVVVGGRGKGTGSPYPKGAGTCEACDALHARGLVLIVSSIGTLTGGEPARAEGGVSLGPRGGLQLRGESDPFVGADLRLTFALSPLTLNPTFDHYFDEDRTLFQVGVNALYAWPVSASVKPYAGGGVALTAFGYDETTRMPGDSQFDSHGSRMNLNLIAGVAFALPWLTPFVQVTASHGKIELVTIAGGLLVSLVPLGGGR